MSACSGVTRRGQSCGFPARRGTSFCINHEDGADTAAASVRAAEASRAARRPPEELIHGVMSFANRANIQSVLDTVARLVIAGRISDSAARLVLRACSIAAHNFDPAQETLKGPVPQNHEWFAYFDRVNAMLQTVGPMLDDAAAGEPGEEHWEGDE